MGNESAIILPVPEAEVVVGALRRQYDRSARLGVPAHITLMYPFFPSEIVLREINTLKDFCASLEATEFSLTQVRRFPATAYLHPDKPPELWINEVSLAPTHRRRGLGKSILRALFKVGQAYNCTTAWVLTDRGNTAAVALYSSVGGTGAETQPDKVVLMYTFDTSNADK